MHHSISRIGFAVIFLLTTITLGSCFVSSKGDLDVFNNRAYSNSVSLKTIKVPMLITKPIVRNRLRTEEAVPKEISDLIAGLKKMKVTIAQTANAQLISDFRTAVTHAAGEEWLSLNHGSQWIYLKVDKNANDIIKRITFTVSSPEENQLVLVNTKCNFTPDQLGKLVNFAMNSEEGKNIWKEHVMN